MAFEPGTLVRWKDSPHIAQVVEPTSNDLVRVKGREAFYTLVKHTSSDSSRTWYWTGDLVEAVPVWSGQGGIGAEPSR